MGGAVISLFSANNRKLGLPVINENKKTSVKLVFY